MDISIRPACASDVEAIVAMLADDELGRTREVIGPRVHPDYVAAFREISSSKSNHLLVAVDSQGVVGCLQLTFIRGLSRCGALRAQIEGVRVASRARGGGIGQRLVSAAIEQARAAGCSLVQLTSDKRRADAHRFYERLGFVATHEGMKLALDDAGT